MVVAASCQYLNNLPIFFIRVVKSYLWSGIKLVSLHISFVLFGIISDLFLQHAFKLLFLIVILIEATAHEQDSGKRLNL